ncbi:MAG: sugar ABC transporter permease [bacterium]|nr:sugar ABC transporter permease [bacterium]
MKIMPSTAKRKYDILPYLLLLPAVIIVSGFVLYPLTSNLLMSFKNAKLIKVSSNYIGFSNYIEILSSATIWQSILRTLIWAVSNIFFMSILGMTTALLFMADFVGKRLLKAVILIPWVLPQVVTGFVWTVMLSDHMGIITAMMRGSGIFPDGFSWFQTGTLSMSAAILTNVWRGFPFFALMLYARLSTLPSAQLDAAQIDGAHGVSLFRYIIFPYAKGVLYTCMVLAFLWTYNAYDIIKIMTNGGPAGATLTLPLLIQREAFEYYNLSKASTMSLVTFVLIAIMFLLYKGLSNFFKQKELE